MSSLDLYQDCGREERIGLRPFTILDTVLREQSVSRAAVQLNMSQSGVSAVLARLRDLLGDPLLVRGKNRLVPTERALEITESLSIITGCADLLTGRTQGGWNASVPRKCLIACVDELSSFLVPAITAEILASSERTTVEFKSMDSSEAIEELGAGRLDTAILSGFDTCSTGQEFLGSDELVCLMSDENRLSRQSHVSSAEYGQSDHVVLASSIRKPQPALDVVLRDAGLWRRNTIAMPFVDVIPHLLERSDLLFTTTRKFSEHYAALLPLHIGRIAVTLPNIRYYQITNVVARDPLRVDWVASKVRLACAPRFADAEAIEG